MAGMEELLTLLFNALLLVFVVKLLLALFHTKIIVILLYILVLLFAMLLSGRFPASGHVATEADSTDGVVGRGSWCSPEQQMEGVDVEQSHMRRCLWTETVGAKKKILNVLYHFFSCLIRFLSPAVEDLINCELSSISVALAYLVVKKGTSGVWTVEHVGCSFSVN